MRVSIHQPNFMPWIGYFNKLYNSDMFIFLDNVECSKNSFFNRNRFKSGDNTFWLTVPISKKSYSQNLKDVNTIDTAWVKKHVKYFKNTHSKTCEPDFLESIISIYNDAKNSDTVSLTDFNISLINNIVSFLDIKTKLLKASDMKLNKKLRKQKLVLEILNSTNATSYISGVGAKDYQHDEDFNNANIELKYNYMPEIISKESIVDIILREGKWKTKEKMTLV